jgi:hypothetical protein
MQSWGRKLFMSAVFFTRDKKVVRGLKKPLKPLSISMPVFFWFWGYVWNSLQFFKILDSGVVRYVVISSFISRDSRLRGSMIYKRSSAR